MNRFTIVSGLIILVFLASVGLAEIPKMINYQGMLTDDSGNPLNGTPDITFRIYNDPTGGTQKWTETHPGVSVTNGLFNVILGSVNPIDTLSFSQDYWLEIQVDNDTMPERLRFTSVGYAYRALVADSALSATPGSGSHWSVTDSVLYTNNYWGIARGGAGNVLYGDSAHTMVNLGVACTTGSEGEATYYSTVSGGSGNIADESWSTVVGGEANKATNEYATIGGGWANAAGGMYSTIGGGRGNTTTYTYSTVGGGRFNKAIYHYATVGGGGQNTADSSYGTVGGGYLNTASGEYATVPGGRENTAFGNYSFTAGRRAKANHNGTFVWADSTDEDFASTGDNQFLVRASGGVGIGTDSPQGALDVSSTTGAFIVPRMTEAQRDALTAVNGMIIYNTTDNQFNFYENGTWVTK